MMGDYSLTERLLSDQPDSVASVDPSMRWAEGEELANAELLKSLVVHPGEFVWPHEIVGLGFDVEGVDERVWVQLPNTASPDSQQFAVTGEDVHVALREMRNRFKAGTHVRGAVLWHSHYNRVGASKLDIRLFPGWLANMGIVYHTPTRSSSAYDHSGLIESTSTSFPVATTDG